MTKAEAEIATKELYLEAFSLSPSSLVTLFEIDVSVIGLNVGDISATEISTESSTIFRFHNNIKLSTSSIIWRGKEYIAAPINAEGFEITSKGVLPTPKLRINVSDEGVGSFNLLRQRIREIGDLTGAKVTRIRTFAKFLDAENFDTVSFPAGFSPNPNSEFPRDVFYIDRKSSENKFGMEFELASLLDVQGQKLPARLVVENSCPFQYRGEGCLYEYRTRRNEIEHGEATISNLLTSAPSIATEFDELISPLLSGITIIDRGIYDSNVYYDSGDSVYLTYNNVNYYFVAKKIHTPYDSTIANSTIPIPPPDRNYWVSDMCSHRIRGCEIRFSLNGSAVGSTLGNLPFGGFLSVNRFK